MLRKEGNFNKTYKFTLYYYKLIFTLHYLNYTQIITYNIILVLLISVSHIFTLRADLSRAI